MPGLHDILTRRGVTQRAIAEATGRSAPTVSQWVTGARPIPADLVPAIEAATGLPRHEIRPDLWPEPAEAA